MTRTSTLTLQSMGFRKLWFSLFLKVKYGSHLKVMETNVLKIGLDWPVQPIELSTKALSSSIQSLSHLFELPFFPLN